MKLRDWLVPDEMQSAASAAHQMLRVVTNTSHFWLKQIFAALVPLLLGGYLGWWLANCMTPDQVKSTKDVITAIMTLVSVLAGFMVTLMLFTGRTSGADTLSVEQASAYVEKITYLLFSQALTLVVHVACVLAGLAWLVAQNVSSDTTVINVLFAVCTGFLSLSLVRTLLLPFQIYEVHHFELAAMVDEKQRAFMASIREDA
jgi:uncharacterized membrane protein YfcA